MNDYADYIIRNGRFYTEESHNPHAEVVAIKGEKFIFVGKQRDFQEEEYNMIFQVAADNEKTITCKYNTEKRTWKFEAE